MLELFPDGARIDHGILTLGGVPATDLARDYGTPLLVYDEATIRARARAYRAAAPDALIAYGTKAFPNVEVLRILAEEGLGADVSTLGELRFGEAAGIPGEHLGNVLRNIRTPLTDPPGNVAAVLDLCCPGS